MSKPSRTIWRTRNR